jgi:hypothetical protein
MFVWSPEEKIKGRCFVAIIIFFLDFVHPKRLMNHEVSEAASVSVFMQGQHLLWLTPQILRIALSKESTRAGAFLTWRRKQSRLPKRRASLKIKRWTNSKEEYFVSETYTIVRAL